MPNGKTLIHFGSPEGSQYTEDTEEYAARIGLILPGQEPKK